MRRVRQVLVVEDDDDIRELLAALLMDAGYEVQTASNGLEALRAALASPPDVIVLDLMMPVMNGWEFLRAQGSDPRLARIPVVAVSASFPSDEVDVSARVAKPYELRTLLAAFRVLENFPVPVPCSTRGEEPRSATGSDPNLAPLG
jgi:CheY-like chemotaxis protein